VISYTNNWAYVLFAAIGSWIGAYLTMTFLHGPPSNPPAPLKPSFTAGPAAKRPRRPFEGPAPQGGVVEPPRSARRRWKPSQATEDGGHAAVEKARQGQHAGLATAT